jgi:isoleucyl-tRNA synthetase
MFSTWYEGLAPLPANAPIDESAFDRLLSIREAVGKVLEPMRAGGQIGASLAAEASVFVDEESLRTYAPVAEELRFLFITSRLDFKSASRKPAEAIAEGDTFVFAEASSHAKCIRCWHYRADVGTYPDDPELCSRCVENVNGAGEIRKYF